MSLILVTGAAGFIGSNLCHALIAQGDYVVGLDAMKVGSSYHNLGELLDCEFFDLVEGDLASETQVSSCLRDMRFDVIYHLAAESHVDRSIVSDAHFWESNVIGTANLLRWAHKRGAKKIVNQITDEVYGPKEKGESFEGDPLRPTSPYAASKAAQYMVGRSYIETYGAPIIHTFPANTYGPRQYPEKLIPKFVSNLLNGGTVPLMKSSHFQRDWLAVDDHVRALVIAAQQGVPGQDYNIPGTGTVSNLEITQRLLGLTGRDESAIQEVPDRKAHDCRYCVNGDKMIQLGWRPLCTLDTYLPLTVQWYRDNGDKYEHQSTTG